MAQIKMMVRQPCQSRMRGLFQKSFNFLRPNINRVVMRVHGYRVSIHLNNRKARSQIVSVNAIWDDRDRWAFFTQ